MVERLQQLVPDENRRRFPRADSKPLLPADRALAFCSTAASASNGAVRCEETYPNPVAFRADGVDREAANWREKLNSLHSDLFGRAKPTHSPVRLEVIDRATDEPFSA